MPRGQAKALGETVGERERVPEGLPLMQREAEGLRLGERVAVGQRVMLPHADTVRDCAAVVALAEAVRERAGELAATVRERVRVGEGEVVRERAGELAATVRERVRVGDTVAENDTKGDTSGKQRRSEKQNRKSFIFWKNGKLLMGQKKEACAHAVK